MCISTSHTIEHRIIYPMQIDTLATFAKDVCRYNLCFENILSINLKSGDIANCFARSIA